ncbi:threonine-phosphate decarboxylase [Aureimonas fodinaquatilis]|uniref:threonine-phosphate decarboxylase n=1 Tax=Aureimonas fodinaquatilis TaxID=2565783 RepID=A0A5B0DRX2_9HYPH|nr:threonine-phosphate decarboxylase CobD [Aureimonas fodinaquatilis]KAA0969554.1 threonine-phosphate decarboxylase [Aureimonas fodinaquatilis]
MRDHGGNIDHATELYGGERSEWIDLSTGINRLPWPVPTISPHAWTDLPARTAMNGLHAAARTAWQVPESTGILAVAGAQAAIQLIPRLRAPGAARVLAPTYNEHAAALQAGGWRVEDVASLETLAGADLAIVVNPNNPDGRCHSAAVLAQLADAVGLLVVDESFADARLEHSLAQMVDCPNLIVLRSFGKFYGLAGVRLGFVLASPPDIKLLAGMLGPWPVSGMAIEIGTQALADRDWATRTISRLQEDAARLDRLASQAGWQIVGGTELFRLYTMPDAAAAKASLARRHIWTRSFAYNQTWLRMGLPGCEGEWARVESAFKVL